ncbi:hypothetical protein OG436_16390 [Streptomyces caniferus]|uniref:Uncharacterized protein n=1 Tax=Streptomyces caniferus TaxID=285557 RepID=A0ABZ1VSI3_9ACTN|nr:hypothetical protein [Streptomyces caniferus]
MTAFFDGSPLGRCPEHIRIFRKNTSSATRTTRAPPRRVPAAGALRPLRDPDAPELDDDEAEE